MRVVDVAITHNQDFIELMAHFLSLGTQDSSGMINDGNSPQQEGLDTIASVGLSTGSITSCEVSQNYREHNNLLIL